ncbi:MAG TPA: amidase family protein, partial [Anaerolineales bacterium]
VGMIFSIMAGRDEKDATSVNQPVPRINFDTNAVRGLKIGVPKEYFITGIQPEVEEKTRAAIGVLKNLGAEICEISLPHTEYAVPVYYIIAPAEASANLARYDGIRYGPRVEADNLWDVYFKTRGQKFGAEVERRIMIGTYALSAGYYDAYYGQAQKVRTLIKRDFENAFKDVDVIAAPTAPTTAFKIGEHVNDPLAMYLEDVFTLPANLAGVPGISFNAGFDKNNLPVGMQLIGPHFREDLLLQATHAYQQATDWHKKQPKL